MTTATDGPHRRELALADLPSVVDLLTECDTAVLGHADFTVEEVGADLRSDSLEPYGWFAPGSPESSPASLVAYGWVARVETTSKVELDAYVRPGHDARLGHEVVSFLEERGVRLAGEAGHAAAVFDIGVYRQDEVTQSWLRGRGWESPTSFVRMRVDLDDATTGLDGAVPGLDLRRVDGAEGDADGPRRAYEVHEDSFTEHYQHVGATYEAWRRELLEKGADWSEVWLAELDGEPAGVLVGTRQFVEDDNAGYVRILGTAPAARGRGVGTALLRHYFDQSRRAGRSAVLLHVDVSNVTNALRLYESVGMRPVLTIDAWTKRAPTPCADTPL